MADNVSGNTSRGHPRSPAGSFRSTAQNARQRFPTSDSQASSRPSSQIPAQDGHSPGSASLRSMESRFSLNEQFAASRREFNFDEDDDASSIHLEPAPTVVDMSSILDDSDAEEGEESIMEVDETEFEHLLEAVDDEIDYYTLLGLTRDSAPSTSQIRAAYHRLSLAFHPDKHPQSRKAAAEKYFTRLQRAYEVLISPQKRVMYDIKGEAGVRDEYKTGGAMASDNPERQIGVRAMDSSEFKQWYMKILRARERRIIEELVDTTGTVSLTLNAKSLFDGSSEYKLATLVGDGIEQDIRLKQQRVDLVAITAGHSFGVRLPGLGLVLRSSWKDIMRGDFSQAEQSNKGDLDYSRSSPRLTFNANISGLLSGGKSTPMDQITENIGETWNVEILPQWQLDTTDDVAVSAGIEHTFYDQNSGSSSNDSALNGLTVNLSTDILPQRAFNIGLAKEISLYPNTRSLQGQVHTTFISPVLKAAPIINIRLSRGLGEKSDGYMLFNSGAHPWPALFRPFFPVHKDRLGETSAPSTCKIGWIWQEGESPFDTTGSPRSTRTSRTIRSDAEPMKHQSWHFGALASQYSASFLAVYGRDLFASISRPSIDSHVRNNTEQSPIPRSQELNSQSKVRLELQAQLHLNGDLEGTVRGVRRVGTFSTISLGVTASPSKGLFVSLSWSRLGQSLVVPIILAVPADLTGRGVFLAVSIPWIAYSAIEFIVIRPRLRKQRRVLLEETRIQLRENVVKRRQEAAEATALMQSVVEAKQSYELDYDGLVIVEATFGVSHAKAREKAIFRPGDSANVTVALSALVDNGQLNLAHGNRKSQLVGFWDPAPLRHKILAVRYLFGGKEHYVEVGGSKSLRMPSREHEL